MRVAPAAFIACQESDRGGHSFIHSLISIVYIGTMSWNLEFPRYYIYLLVLYELAIVQTVCIHQRFKILENGGNGIYIVIPCHGNGSLYVVEQRILV